MRGKREREEGSIEREESGKGIKIAFWNVAGLAGKDVKFWKDIAEWDVMVLIETWVEGKGWERVKSKLPTGYVWKLQEAKREFKKGRAKGGMIMGIRRELMGESREVESNEEGIIEGWIREGSESWRVVGVYVNGDMERKLRRLGGWMEERRGGWKTLIGGDFNARTGGEGGSIDLGEEDGERDRNSKDRMINGDGRKLLECIGERGWVILNGGIEGDEKGEWTYTGGRGETIIDYILVREEDKGEIQRLEVGDKIDSDHHPLTVWIKGSVEEEERVRRRREVGGKKRKLFRGVWNETGREGFREKLGELKGEEGEVEENMRGVGERVRGILEEMDRGIEREVKDKDKGCGWWDRECGDGKKNVRRELRNWRRRGGEGRGYREARREFRKLCERKKEEENRRWEKEVEEIRREGQIWRLVNRERRKWKGVNKDIKREEWEEYFRNILGGVENRVIVREGREREIDEEVEIGREEIEGIIRNLKDGKAMGGDRLPNEVWKYGGEGVIEWIRVVCNRIWRGEGWPDLWKEGVIVPVVKKGKGDVVEEYRGVTLMSTLYKIYTSVLTERLVEEIEGKGILSKNQVGFRKGKGALDNIYVLNYIVSRQIGRRKKGLTALFVDIKAAFDSVDRRTVVEAMRKRGVREGLVVRVEELLGETRCRVRIEGEEGGCFWTARGVRQGCPLSPTLFNLVLADLEEEMGKVKWGGVLVGKERMYTLTYADDMVLLSENEEEMKSMVERLERYLDRKGLEVNVKKTKIIRFRQGGGRKKKIGWRWKGKAIEEVKEIDYLGYRFQSNGKQEAHIKSRIKKAAVVMGQVWGIGKRRFGKDWGRRVWLYDRLVWSVMEYGAEIWGWKERGLMERMHERFLRWVLGVNHNTPGYMVREELQREKMRSRAARRAWGFEKRVGEGKGGELTRRCLEEIVERAAKGKDQSAWEKERRDFFEERGIEIRAAEVGGEEGEELWKGVEEKERKMQEVERWEKIGSSRFNKWYGIVKEKGIPEYLKKGWGESRWRRVARYRLGNEMLEARYWEEEDKRNCRLCGGEIETWEHIWEKCREWKTGGEDSWGNAVGRVLGGEGEGETWMREVDAVREGRGEE